MKTLELRGIYRTGAMALESAGVADAAIDAWYLLEHVTGITKAGFYADPFRKLSESQAEQYEELIALRAKHIPLQHITGVQNFMGYDFKVNENVLVPRQDTECLVEEALKVMKSDMKILDMCTGSGCILISLTKMARERKHFTNLQGLGLDISEEALKVARENASALLGDDSITLAQSDLYSSIEGKESFRKSFDLIISNPPYICTAEIEKLADEVKLHDPFIALDGKEDGLFFYRRIIKDAPEYLKSGGWLMFEIGYDQGESVPELMKEAGFSQIVVKKDLSGLDRVVLGRYNNL
ncbi:MAG: peptide chain release factor N(5)-glutamine methyltransferase [Dorea sp.]|nr:peptide chain release factor N(5)-glutamine methyltransferase [Dorea sp.]